MRTYESNVCERWTFRISLKKADVDGARMKVCKRACELRYSAPKFTLPGGAAEHAAQEADLSQGTDLSQEADLYREADLSGSMAVLLSAAVGNLK